MGSTSEKFLGFLRENGVSLKAAAAVMECTVPFVSLIAHGKRRPSVRTQLHIEKLTKGSIRVTDWLDDEIRRVRSA